MISGVLRAVPVLVALAGVGGDGLTADHAPNGALHPQWTEVQWPFPIDQWGTGRAFRCGGGSLRRDGDGVSAAEDRFLQLRAKASMTTPNSTASTT